MFITVSQVDRMYKQAIKMTLNPRNDDVFRRELYLLLCAAIGVSYTEDITPEMHKYLNLK